LPAKFREVAKSHFVERFFVTRGLDKCLFMLPEEEWRAQENRLKAISFTKKESRTFNRLFFSGAAEMDCDAQGRILLPQYLKDYAEIKRDVVIVGVSSRIEIWAKDKWEDFYGNSRQSFEEIAERLFNE
jgi:MraZ protein